MKDEQDEKLELMSLNSEVSEFSLQELEERLETDPLAVGELLNFTSSLADGSDACNTFCFACNVKG